MFELCGRRAQFRNSAVSATTSSYTSQCVRDFVPPDADLVLVEFSVNDWEVVDPAAFTWMDNSLRWALCLHALMDSMSLVAMLATMRCGVC